MSRPISFAFLLLASVASTAPVAVSAQLQMVQTLPPRGVVTDADKLADAMRTLGANPRDLNALIEAGELSLTLGDPTAAATLFKRADQIDPMNGRVKAGMARILVQQERPGEALRYFDQAAGYGLDPRTFAGDRGLAYDLIGEQQRAQRDYRLALQAGPQDEVQRRYALSLAISGRQDEALKQVEPLVRKGDRGAWRARAFILAMGGDVPGAEKIAGTMMPPNMASGLAGFFQQLPKLAPVDKAFAVHFGEVRASAARLADARMAPPLPALTPEPTAPVRVAAAAPPPQPTATERERERRERERDRRRGKVAPVVPAATPPVQVAAQTQPALPEPPRYPGSGVVFSAPQEVSQKLPPRTYPPQLAQREATPPQQLASAAPRPVESSSPAIPSVPRSEPAAPPPAPVESAAAAPPPQVVTPTTPVSPKASEDTILARIIAGISVPQSELHERPAPVVAPPSPPESPAVRVAPPREVAQTQPPRKVGRTPAQPVRAAAEENPPPRTTRTARGKAPAKVVEEADAEETKAKTTGGRGKATAKNLAMVDLAETSRTPTSGRKTAAKADDEADQAADAEAKPTKKQTAAERKAEEAKKLAAAKKAEEAKQAAEERKAAKAQPSRIWVQVAGGANEGDLPKAWAKAQAKSSTLNGKHAYTTPLRATNRVVTGPFKTDAEARAMVNKLRKEGVEAFTFTSDAGQKMTKIEGK